MICTTEPFPSPRTTTMPGSSTPVLQSVSIACSASVRLPAPRMVTLSLS